MFFTIKNNRYLSDKQLKTNTLLNAYYIVYNYPLSASDKMLEEHLKAKYNTTLKNLCIKLLLNITFYKDETENNFILLFKDPAFDRLAQLITYGNGAIPGSKILQNALKN